MREPRLVLAATDPMSVILLRGQMQFLREAGFDVSLLTGPGKIGEEAAAREGVRFVPVGMARAISAAQDAQAQLALVKTLRSLAPDVVNYGTPKASLQVGVAAALLRVPVRIWTFLGLRQETATGGLRLVLDAATRVTSAVSHRILCAGPSLRQRALDLHLISERKAIVFGDGSTNGVDLEWFHRDAALAARGAELRRKLGFGDDVVFGFVGRLHIDKGAREMVEAWRRIRRPGARMIFVGPDELDDPTLEREIATLRDDPLVHFAGMQMDVPLYYAAMDTILMPTYREGMNNVILEAAAMGMPTITTRVTGTDGTVHGETGLVVEARNAGQLADAMQTYLDDAALRRRHGAAARARMEALFDRKKIWEQWLRLYRDVLTERGHGDLARRLRSPAI